jgi:hypothetical protein
VTRFTPKERFPQPTMVARVAYREDLESAADEFARKSKKWEETRKQSEGPEVPLSTMKNLGRPPPILNKNAFFGGKAPDEIEMHVIRIQNAIRIYLAKRRVEQARCFGSSPGPKDARALSRLALDQTQRYHEPSARPAPKLLYRDFEYPDPWGDRKATYETLNKAFTKTPRGVKLPW